MQGMLKAGKDLLIGKEYWDYLGGNDTYEELLDLFDSVGKACKESIASKIREVARSKMNI